MFTELQRVQFLTDFDDFSIILTGLKLQFFSKDNYFDKRSSFLDKFFGEIEKKLSYEVEACEKTNSLVFVPAQYLWF